MAKPEKAQVAKKAPKEKGVPKEAAPPPSRPKALGKVPPRLRERFRKLVVPALMRERGYTNPFQVPRLEKIVINMGVGEAVSDSKKIEAASRDLTMISGQKPIVIRARKSIANFKIRDGWPIGCKVTLRRGRMYEFLDRLINIAIPRIR
ncbi:MAG: 50S ribosomal protein L5, partial [Candidatus Rokuibacteriota bacterium]